MEDGLKCQISLKKYISNMYTRGTLKVELVRKIHI